MNFRRKVSLAVISIFSAFTVSAQDPIDIFNISQTSFSFSTSRSTAMGGAFTALGADGASAMINPAGIGMYRANDIGITMSSLSTTMESSTFGSLGYYNTSDKKKNAPLNNLTFVQNVYSSNNSPVRSANISFVVNRSNDLNMRQYTSGNYETSSILDMFAANLYNINPNKITSDNDYPLDVYIDASVPLWGSMMAYNTGLLYVTDDAPYKYTLSAGDNGTLFSGDEIYPDLTILSSGYNMDYAFSGGLNIGDRLYLGATISVLDYQYSKQRLYSEFANIDINHGDLDYFDYLQTLNVTGTGTNFKFGATLDAGAGLKIGAAFHTPSIYFIKEEYFEDMDSYYLTSPKYIDAESPYSLAEYRVVTPAKVLLGASLTLGKYAILSFDYDRTFYGNMKVTTGLYGAESSLNSDIKSTYQATNNYRVGAEINFGGIVYLRGGYAAYGNPLKGEADSENGYQNISGGIGLKFGGIYFDMTYVNMVSNTSPEYFYARAYEDGAIHSQQSFTNHIRRNSLMFTLGSRF